MRTKRTFCLSWFKKTVVFRTININNIEKKKSNNGYEMSVFMLLIKVAKCNNL